MDERIRFIARLLDGEKRSSRAYVGSRSAASVSSL
jgi:hypothetical protein